jgi:hypothetical protein
MDAANIPSDDDAHAASLISLAQKIAAVYTKEFPLLFSAR